MPALRRIDTKENIMRIILKRLVAHFVIASVFGLGIMQPAQAALIGAAQVTATDGQRHRDRIAAALARPAIMAQLQELGISTADAQARVAALTDAEAAAVADKIESLPAGGDGVIGALVFIFVLLLVTDLLGLTKVYPFTRPVKR
jgi:hypothetical protein